LYTRETLLLALRACIKKTAKPHEYSPAVLVVYCRELARRLNYPGLDRAMLTLASGF